MYWSKNIDTIVCMLLMVTIGGSLYILNQKYLDKVVSFPKVGDLIYDVDGYTCIESVLYRKGRSYTKLVDVNNNPLKCHNVKMSRREFNTL